MLGRLFIILLCAASLGASGAIAQTAVMHATTAPLGVQPPPPPAPADTVEAAVAAPDTTEPEAILPEVAPHAVSGILIYGTAALSNGLPLPEVTANLFIAGLEVASATTDTSGIFSIRHAIDRTADETVVLWFTPPRGIGLVREIVVLKESRATREGRQFGPCVTRVPISDSTLVDVQILDQQTYAQKLEESGCMDMIVETAVEYELSYDLEPASTFSLATTSSSRFLQQFGGTEMAVGSNSTANFLVTVDSIGPDGMALGLEYQDRSYTTDNPQARGGVDFSPLIGQKANMYLSPQGELSRFVGFEALPEIEINPGETLNREGYVNQLKYLLPTLSAGPVARGDSWAGEHMLRKTREGGFTTINMSVTYTLVGETVVRGVDCLEINAESVITVKGEGTMRGNPFTMNMSGTGSEKIYFAHERGMMLEKSGTVKVEGAIESVGMNIPVVNTSESSVEVTF